MDTSSDRLTRADFNAMMRAHHRDCIAHGEDVEFHTWALEQLVDEPEEATFDLAADLRARRERLTGQLLADAANYRRRKRLAGRSSTARRMRVTRTRESHRGRPGHKRVTVRSSAKSGDSGDDGPAEPAPVLALAPPSLLCALHGVRRSAPMGRRPARMR